MNDKTRIKAGVSTHSPEAVKEKPTGSEFKVKNNGGESQMLIDPEGLFADHRAPWAGR